MPVKVTFQHDNTGAITTASGKTTGTELADAMREMFSDDDRTKKFRYGLVDFSTIENLDMSAKEIINLSKIHIAASKVNRDIIVSFAIRKDVVYGLVRIWEVYAEFTGWEVNVSRTLPDAKKWIEEKLNVTF